MLLTPAALAAAFFMPSTAHAATSTTLPCLPHDQMAAFLQAEHGEVLAGWGADPRQILTELWTDPQDGSWTVTMMGPDGLTCILSWGRSWQDEKGWEA